MAVIPQAATGELSYNGFLFPPAVHITAEATPVQDATGRYTKWVRYTINVECILFPGCDDTLTDGVTPNPNALFPSSLTDLGGSSSTNGFQRLRHLLTRQGETLTFTGKGFGNDFVINTNTQDVQFGPRPKVIRWEPVGNNKAVRLVWAVEVTVADCSLTRTADGRIAEFGYSIEYDISDTGLTMRTVTGFMTIVNRLKSSTPSYTVDRFREQIQVIVPYGFKRESQSYNISADGRTCQFTVVDQELETDHPYQPGMADQRATHSIRSTGNLVGHTWVVSLNASYRVAKGADKGRAWNAFLFLVKSRRKAIQHARVPAGKEDGDEKPMNMAFPVELKIEDSVYGRDMRFSMSWLVFTTYRTVLKASGLFAHEEGTSWTTWHSSLLNKFKTWNQRGHAQLRAQEPGQTVVTLCNSNYPQPIQDAGRLLPQVGTYSLFRSECPPKEESWVKFKPEVTLLEDHKTMTSHATGGVDDYKPKVISPSAGSTGLEYERGSGDTNRPVIHTQGLTRYRVKFEGTAIRIGHKIPKPVLTKYGGADVTRPIGKGTFKQVEVGVSESCPVYRAEWSQEYELYDPPKGELIEVAPTTAGFPR